MSEVDFFYYYNDYDVAKSPIISEETETCRNCGTELIFTGNIKPMYPPLRVMACEHCKLLFWKETV